MVRDVVVKRFNWEACYRDSELAMVVRSVVIVSC